MTAASTSVQPGDVIAGKYRVDRVLGAGGMGVVVAATHQQLDQRVALKFLLPEIAAREEVVARFLREARSAVRIHSEHVSRVLDVGTLDTGAPYMVMELLEGDDLEHVLLKRGPLPAPEAVGYVLQACEAIAEAHSLGIVHRDLKPANLFLARRPSGPPVVKVLDFGISKAPLSAKEKALTSEAALMGSPAYMSPEQMRASRDVDARSDIWSLGVVLHELLTRSLPFPGDTVAALVTATLHEPHQPMHAAGGGAPSALQPVVDRCLEKDAARRFASVAELARALVPFGPPRGEQSLERIATVLGEQRGVVAAAQLPPQPASPILIADPMTPNVTVTGGLPAGKSTLSPTSTGTSGAKGRRLFLPGVLLGVLTVGGLGYAVLRATGAGPRTAAVAAGEPSTMGETPKPPPPASTAPTPGPAVTVTPSAPVTVTSSAPVMVTPVAVPSAVATPSATASAAATVAAVTVAHGKQPAHAASTSTAAATPACKVVSYFDADGNKRFRRECP